MGQPVDLKKASGSVYFLHHVLSSTATSLTVCKATFNIFNSSSVSGLGTDSVGCACICCCGVIGSCDEAGGVICEDKQPGCIDGKSPDNCDEGGESLSSLSPWGLLKHSLLAAFEGGGLPPSPM